MSYQKKDSVIGGEFLLFDIDSDKIFTMEDFDSDQRMMAESCTDFLEREVIPLTDKIDSKNHPEIMPELLTKSGELGLLGLSISENYGGMNMSFNTSMLIADIVGITGSFSTAYGAHTGIATLPLKYYGNEDQKKKFLTGLVSGELKGAYCLTEPDSGSDANSGKSKAILNSDKSKYIINGQKMWISNGGFADIYIVFAKIDDDKNLTAFIVEKSREGITMNPEEDKLGIKGSSTRQIFFNDVEIPVENMLGKREGGFKIALNVLNIGRIKLGAGVLGGCRGIIDNAISYSLERIQFNVPISSFGAIKQKLAMMIVQTFSCESICYRAGDDIEKKISFFQKEGKSLNESELEAIELFSVECAISKIYGSEILDFVVDEGLQIYGGMGFSEEAPMARPYRDARISRIYEGTNEINRMLAFGELIKRGFQTKELNLKSAGKKIPTALIKRYFKIGKLTAENVIQNYKYLFLLLSKYAADSFGLDLEHEQEIIMNLSDIMGETYVAESVFLRVEKIKLQKGNSIDLEHKENLKRLQLYEANLKIVHCANTIVDSLPDTKNKLLRLYIRLLTPQPILNPTKIRRSLAKYIIEKKDYPW
mgnify:CR=1 FL=1